MGSNLVIVALPADDDPVWKVSSETKPHLTMLFLGDAPSNPNTQRIISFVEHAVTMSEHGGFYLDVDYRDVLGPDKADVLFFAKDWSFQWVNQFRNQLLQNTDIKSAYESAEQFPEWQPHITLGYPTDPAHEDKMPDYGLSMIHFNRIAVWTADYEGVEFRLKWPERESELAVAYSAVGKSAVAELLHVSEKPWSDYTKADYTLEQWHAACLIHLHDGPSTSKSDCKLPVKTPDGTLNRGGVHAAAAALAGARGGVNASDDQKAKAAKALIRYYGQLGEDPPESLTHSVVDNTGDAMAQRAELGKDFLGVKNESYGEVFVEGLLEGDLAHFGVKGMRWGVSRSHQRSGRIASKTAKKAPPEAVAPKATSTVPKGEKRKTKINVQGGENHPAHPDAIHVAQAKAKLAKSGPSALSNKELRDVANRVQLEQQVKQLTMPKGRKFVKGILGQQGSQAANQVVGKGARKALKI